MASTLEQQREEDSKRQQQNQRQQHQHQQRQSNSCTASLSTAGPTPSMPHPWEKRTTHVSGAPRLLTWEAKNPVALRPQVRAFPAAYTSKTDAAGFGTNTCSNHMSYVDHQQQQPRPFQPQRPPAASAQFQRASAFAVLPQQQLPHQAAAQASMGETGVSSAAQMQALEDLASDLEEADGALGFSRPCTAPGPHEAPREFGAGGPLPHCPVGRGQERCLGRRGGAGQQNPTFSRRASAVPNGSLRPAQRGPGPKEPPQQQKAPQAAPPVRDVGASFADTAMPPADSAAPASAAVDISALDAAQVRALYLQQVSVSVSGPLSLVSLSSSPLREKRQAAQTPPSAKAPATQLAAVTGSRGRRRAAAGVRTTRGGPTSRKQIRSSLFSACLWGLFCSGKRICVG